VGESAVGRQCQVEKLRWLGKGHKKKLMTMKKMMQKDKKMLMMMKSAEKSGVCRDDWPTNQMGTCPKGQTFLEIWTHWLS
jgi:hypothetical protein